MSMGERLVLRVPLMVEKPYDNMIYIYIYTYAQKIGFKNTTVQGPNLVNQKAILRVSVFFRQSQMMFGKHLPQVHTMCIHTYILYTYIYIYACAYSCQSTLHCIALMFQFSCRKGHVQRQQLWLQFGMWPLCIAASPGK